MFCTARKTNGIIIKLLSKFSTYFSRSDYVNIFLSFIVFGMYEIVFFLFLSLKIIEEQNKELNFRMTKHYILYTFFLIF